MKDSIILQNEIDFIRDLFKADKKLTDEFFTLKRCTKYDIVIYFQEQEAMAPVNISANVRSYKDGNTVLWYTEAEDDKALDTVGHLNSTAKEHDLVIQIRELFVFMSDRYQVDCSRFIDEIVEFIAEREKAPKGIGEGDEGTDDVGKDKDDNSGKGSCNNNDSSSDLVSDSDNSIGNTIEYADVNTEKYKRERESYLKISRLDKKDDTRKYSGSEVSTWHVCTDRLMKELKDIHLSDMYKEGVYTVENIDDSLYDWNISINTFDEESDMGKDMKKLNIKSIVLNLEYPDTYPFAPPFVRIISPKMNSDCILCYGAFCLELLSPSGWSSAYWTESIVLQIISSLYKCGTRVTGVSDPTYTRNEAHAIFESIVSTHEAQGWYTPPLSEG